MSPLRPQLVTHSGSGDHAAERVDITEKTVFAVDTNSIEFHPFVMAASLILPGAIAELFAQATYSGQLTQADRYGIAAALLSGDLSEEEQGSINRLLQAVKRQRITLSPELSVVL